MTARRAQRCPPEHVVGTYAHRLPSGPADALMADVLRHLNDTRLAWIGGTGDDDPFYYRIHSPVLMIEYDCHQGVFLDNPEPEPFHVHTIVRTPNGGDYGRDLLAMAELLGPHGEKDVPLFAALAHAVLTEENLADAVRETLVESWFADLIGVVDRAVERGELSRRPSATDFLPQILLSVMVTRPMFEGKPADADYLTRCVDHALLPALLHS
ncbi:DUF3500 domain-containing protein [Streptomyces sp. NPDC088253]|uniref:DUF3500 domain-containing protein n=1 Tax=Streptomyces sp. NPDC088253 TaxID=3365846 RepID=UPI0038146DCF